MPTTFSRRCRGITPIGDSVPFGVSTEHRVADEGAELAGQLVAEEDAGQVVVAAAGRDPRSGRR